MQLNFLGYFQTEAAAKGNVPFLLNLDLLLANEGIRRQETQEQVRVSEQSRSVENAAAPPSNGAGSDTGVSA